MSYVVWRGGDMRALSRLFPVLGFYLKGARGPLILIKCTEMYLNEIGFVPLTSPTVNLL